MPATIYFLYEFLKKFLEIVSGNPFELRMGNFNAACFTFFDNFFWNIIIMF
jgi:hypothetical protein